MSPKPNTTRRRAGSTEAARFDFFVSSGNLIRLLFALLLFGFAFWGFSVSADVGNSVGDLGFPGTEHDLAVTIGILTWMTIFGPFAILGAALLHSAFTRDDGLRLAPLQLFSLLVLSRALAEKYGRIPPRAGDDGTPAFPEPHRQITAPPPELPQSDDTSKPSS